MAGNPQSQRQRANSTFGLPPIGREFRTIIIPIDGSPNSDRAWDFYKREMMKPNDTVYIVHVPESLSLPLITLTEGAKIPVANWQVKLQDRADSLTKMESEYTYRLQSLKLFGGFLVPSAEATSKDSIGAEVCKAAETKKADMLIMSTKGWGGLKRKFFGTVTDYVIHHVHCPIVVVPPRRSNEIK